MEQAKTARELSVEMRALLERAGIRVTQLKILGRWVHIDTFKKYDAPIRAVFAAIATEVHHLPGDAKGRHLDDSKAYRLVATLA